MTRRLDIDFRMVRPRLPRAGIALLLIGLLAASLAAVQASLAYTGWRAASEARDRTLAHRQVLAQQRRAPAPTPAEQRSVRNATLLADALRAPWGQLLGALETGPAGTVALLAVEPLPARHEVRITGEARDYAAMLDYLRYLQHQPGLAAVTLAGHQLQRQAGGTPVRFQVQARWEQK